MDLEDYPSLLPQQPLVAVHEITSTLLTSLVRTSHFVRELRQAAPFDDAGARKAASDASAIQAGSDRQVQYINGYLSSLGATLAVVESHYRDKHYAADYRALYARAIRQRPNFVTRVHAFRHAEGTDALTSDALLTALLALREHPETVPPFEYLGFVCIRPLDATPIGTTVLRPFPAQSARRGTGYLRCFEAPRRYETHLLGARLSVEGLAFTQQDVGASACATVAVWCSLQRARDHEELASSTPAEITLRATAEGRPHGRIMPSEGLTVDQISTAVHSFGLAPSVFNLEHLHRAEWEPLIRGALASQAAPVLILQRSKTQAHAVAVAGCAANDWDPASRAPAYPTDCFFLHDDRLGPYVRAAHATEECDLVTRAKVDEGNPIPNTAERALYLRTVKGPRANQQRKPDTYEEWWVQYLVVPQHPGVHFSLAELHFDLAPRLGRMLLAAGERMKILSHQVATKGIGRYDAWMPRTKRYLEVRGDSWYKNLTSHAAAEVARSWAMPRYVGVIRFYGLTTDAKANRNEFVDFLIDTTSTPINPRGIGMVLQVDPASNLARAAIQVAALLKLSAVQHHAVSEIEASHD